jgi:hypothetical protein
LSEACAAVLIFLSVTAPARNCFVPTLPAGNVIAAYEVPPIAKTSATMASALWRSRRRIRENMEPPMVLVAVGRPPQATVGVAGHDASVLTQSASAAR